MTINLLTSLIKRAEKNGFDLKKWCKKYLTKDIFGKIICEINFKHTYTILIKYLMKNYMWKLLIYDHGFAKCLWGDKRMWINEKGELGFDDPIEKTRFVLYWQYRLQQFIILSDKEQAEYLKQFVKE